MELTGDICKVYTAGYSFHRKPFYMNEPEGVKSYLFRFQTEGNCLLRYKGGMDEVEVGDLHLYAPDEPYELKIDYTPNAAGLPIVESGDYHIFFGGEWADRWWNHTERPAKVKIPLSDNIVDLLRQISMEKRRIDDPYPEILSYYMKILCLSIDRYLSEQPISGPKTYLAYQIKNYIEENASTAFKLDDVAMYVGISVSRAVHLFKEAFDTTIMQYALDVRLNMAQERIVFSPMPLEEVAESSGFANYTYFHRVFRSRFGMSPKEFRISKREHIT
ncbi:AraC family transcriptional regulator [Paenibacillus nuruki]|uniref:AraC family transcriptional regulator n=1 Tax=Paenibacillus nuruki TaxID=1886670 RepID=UPI002803D144|nr:AraC family transcriptional regulator [Paenibacillus nuruki]CAJ1314418.1 AraC family transcriptional regulator [Paenibacillus nuruki]